MKFAHIADCHIGGWRDEKLRLVSMECFSWTIRKCVEENVSFVVLCGDVFHTPFPPVDCLKVVVEGLKLLKDACIPVYFIGGSHDWSQSGRSFLEIVESAGLARNVMQGEFSSDGKLILKPVLDEKMSVWFVGIGGRRAGLERELFDALDRESLENLSGKKIFLFHTLVEELKPKGLEGVKSVPLSLFPKKFSYYAGGHLHKRLIDGIGGIPVVYPGPLFPDTFSELEDLGGGSFVIVDDWKPRSVFPPSRKVKSIIIDCTGLSVNEVVEKVKSSSGEIRECIILLRLFGRLRGSRASQIPLQELVQWFEGHGAFHVLKNTYGVEGDEIVEVKVAEGTAEEIEQRIIWESDKKVFSREKELTIALLKSLSSERGDGETVAVFEERVFKDVEVIVSTLGVESKKEQQQ